MTRFRVLPYKQGSRSARALADALGGKVLRLENSTFTAKPDDVVVNWGNSKTDREGLVNRGYDIKGASNKLTFFQMLGRKDPDIIPKFWLHRGDIPAKAYPVVCRTVLEGHSGAGIVIADSPEELVPAQLYVKYVKKQDEYRVHIGRGRGSHAAYTTIAVQKKARRRETPESEVNWRVRNHGNGFVFIRNGFVTPDAVIEVARRALDASTLDFGAVDVIYNRSKDRAYVLEINTAPGMEGQTVEDYAEFFRGREVAVGTTDS